MVDISLAQGEPRAGYDAMATHAWSGNHCQGGEYEGPRCSFKREMVTENYWTERAQQAEERRQQRELQQQQMALEPSEIPEATTEEAPEVSEEPGLTEELQEAPSAVGDGGNEMLAEPMAVAAGTHWSVSASDNFLDPKSGEALQKQDVTKDTHPEWSDSRERPEPLDTEGSGSPVPTEHQDINDGPNWDSDPSNEGDAVLESQDVEKDTGPSPEKGKSQWTTTEGLADPVTSASLTDVERNPIQSLMEGEYEGFVPHSEVQDAISAFESNS